MAMALTCSLVGWGRVRAPHSARSCRRPVHPPRRLGEQTPHLRSSSAPGSWRTAEERAVQRWSAPGGCCGSLCTLLCQLISLLEESTVFVTLPSISCLTASRGVKAPCSIGCALAPSRVTLCTGQHVPRELSIAAP